jgi:hypothetical protein
MAKDSGHERPSCMQLLLTQWLQPVEWELDGRTDKTAPPAGKGNMGGRSKRRIMEGTTHPEDNYRRSLVGGGADGKAEVHAYLRL